MGDGCFCIVGLPPSDLTIYEMILTQCAVCATELGLTLGKKCGRCSTPQGRGQVLGLHAC